MLSSPLCPLTPHWLVSDRMSRAVTSSQVVRMEYLPKAIGMLELFSNYEGLKCRGLHKKINNFVILSFPAHHCPPTAGPSRPRLTLGRRSVQDARVIQSTLLGHYCFTYYAHKKFQASQQLTNGSEFIHDWRQVKACKVVRCVRDRKQACLST